MSGFLAAKERKEAMNRRLKNYHQSSLNADHASVKSKTAFIPEATFERVGKAAANNTRTANSRTSATGNTRAANNANRAASNAQGTRAANAANRTANTAHSAPAPQIPAAPTSLFGIELTRDNCLIIALILMLMKEKAELPLIAALIFLLI